MQSKIMPLVLASLMLGPSAWCLQSVDARSDSTQVESRKVESRSDPNPAADPARENKVGVPLIRNLGQDQLAIWSSPTKVRLRHPYWIVPVSGSLALLTHYDSDITARLPDGPTFISNSSTISNYGIGSALGVAGGMYLFGRLTANEHARETGFLSGEAAADSFAIITVGKYAAGRERPNALQHAGDFRSGGVSFPSAHAAVAFSIATVVAHEYPGIGTTLLSYGAATGIGATRVLGREHFVSDVAVGALIGWFTGRQVYRAHHKPNLPGENWGTFEKTPSTTDSNRPFHIRAWDLLRIAISGQRTKSDYFFMSSVFQTAHPWQDSMLAAMKREDAQREVGDVGVVLLNRDEERCRCVGCLTVSNQLGCGAGPRSRSTISTLGGKL